jgi:tyrosinase
MMQRSHDNPEDVAGLTYWANIHATVAAQPNDCSMGDPQHPLWDQCQHASDYFLPWHRMYLYYFERVLRAASGDPNLTLPYWNYESQSEQSLPAAFISPAIDCKDDPSAHPGCNALFLSGRAMNHGEVLPVDANDDSSAMLDTTFEFAFGGGPPPALFGLPPGGSPLPLSPHPCHFNSGNYGDLEMQPHNIIHCDVGGLMCNPQTAARDPAFFLHHAEIDHLWKVWLAQGGGRKNPSTPVWLNQKFCFYDENRAVACKTNQEVLNTIAQLSYRYDDDPLLPPPNAPMHLAGAANRFSSQPPVKLLPRTELNVELNEETKSANLKLPVDIKEKILALLGDTQLQHAVLLNLVLSNVQDSSGLHYEIYANLPAGQSPARESIYFIGNLGLFLHRGPHETTVNLSMSRYLTATRDQSIWDQGQLTLTFVPRAVLDPATHKPVPLPSGPRVTIVAASIEGR